MSSIEFLQPRFRGARFDGGEIPVDVLKDLIVMRDMILEQARWQYKECNPDRSSLPSEFSKIDLKLVGIEDGSARPVLKLTTSYQTIDNMLPYQKIFEEARDRMIDIIKSIKHDMHQYFDNISPKALSSLGRLGKSLLAGESMEFSAPTLQTPIKLTVEVHSLLAEVIGRATPARVATLRGRIHKIDQKNEVFTMQQIYGPQINGPLPNIYSKIFFDAFNGYQTGATVQIECKVYYRSGQPGQIQSISKVRLLDRFDVPAQLDEMRGIRDGWLDGHGTAPSSKGLDWLSETFNRCYPHNATLPYVCPTPEGGINMEWSVGQREIGLEIDIEKHHGEWSWDDVGTGASDERRLDLDKHDSWEWMARQIQSMAEMPK